VGETWDGLINARSAVGEITAYDASSLRSKLGAEIRDLDPKQFVSNRRSLRTMTRYDMLATVAAALMAVAAPGGRKQVVATFEKDEQSYAVPIGFESDGQYKIYSDEMFFIEDPHELYKHWPADVWQSVDQHQVKPGMTELEADFAVGLGVPDAGSSSSERTVRYANGGKPLVVVYRHGKAAEITPGS